jgi:hypothetical protein
VSVVGEHAPVDHVGQLPLERPDGLEGLLALGEFAVVVVPAGAVVADLGDRGGVDDLVELAVAAPVEPVTVVVT